MIVYNYLRPRDDNQHFFSKSPSTEMKRVAWPPVAPAIETHECDNNGTAGAGRNDNANRFSPGPKVAPPVPPKPSAREIANAHQVRTYRNYSLSVASRVQVINYWRAISIA